MILVLLRLTSLSVIILRSIPVATNGKPRILSPLCGCCPGADKLADPRAPAFSQLRSASPRASHTLVDSPLISSKILNAEPQKRAGLSRSDTEPQRSPLLVDKEASRALSEVLGNSGSLEIRGGNQTQQSWTWERGMAQPHVRRRCLLPLTSWPFFDVKCFSFVPQVCGLGPVGLGALEMTRPHFGGTQGDRVGKATPRFSEEKNL